MATEEGTKDLTFTLDPRAAISLTDGNTTDRKATPTQLIHELHNQGSILVWIRHTDGPNGPITALAEQYHP